MLNTQLHELEEVVEGDGHAEIEEQLNPGGARIKGGELFLKFEFHFLNENSEQNLL